MTDKDIKKLGRGELLELLLESEKQCTLLKEELDGKNKELDRLQKQLQDRSIKLDEAGSIAEAALRVNGVYEAAEKAAADYLDNIRSLSLRQEAVCAEREQKSIQNSEKRMQETVQLCNEMQKKTEEECRNLEDATRAACERATAAAKVEVENYWNSLSGKLEDFYQAHEGIKEILGFYNMKLPGQQEQKQ